MTPDSKFIEPRRITAAALATNTAYKTLSEQLADIVFDGNKTLSIGLKYADLIQLIDTALFLARYQESNKVIPKDEVLSRDIHVGNKI
jgi:hypothetical protein